MPRERAEREGGMTVRLGRIEEMSRTRARTRGEEGSGIIGEDAEVRRLDRL